MRDEIKKRIEMINRGEVPEGYKKTRVGIIPVEWDVKKINKVANILRGASPRPISDLKWFDNDSNIGWVRISDVSRSKKVLTETEQYLSKKGIEKSRLVKKDNIIMSICATVGKPIYTGFDVCIHDGFVIFDELNIDKEYFYYLLLDKEKSWHKYGQTGSQMNLNTNIVGNERISIPINIKEQQTIAQILSTWDEAIELKEKLIEEKQKQKKGLMQKLLTGRVRLPGFEGEWEEKQISEVSKVINGGTPSTENSEYWDGEIPWCTPADITSSGKEIIVTTRYITKEGLENSSANLLLVDSILMCSRATIGPRAINKVPMTTNQGFKSFVCKKNLNYEFFYYLIEIYVPIFLRKASGSTFLEVSKKDVENTIVFLPPIKEQKAIADVLSTADKEIDLLNQELEQLKLQKKGLMQLLLTGIVRVKC